MWVHPRIDQAITSHLFHCQIQTRVGNELEGEFFWCVKVDSDWTSSPWLKQQWNETRIIFESYQIVTILLLPTLVMIYTYSRICTHLWTVFHYRTAMRFGHACHLSVIETKANRNQNLIGALPVSGSRPRPPPPLRPPAPTNQ